MPSPSAAHAAPFPRSRSRFVAAVTVVAVLTVGVPASLIAVSRLTLGAWHPLPGLGTWTGIQERLSRPLTSTEIAPIVMRVLLTAAWLLWAALVLSLSSALAASHRLLAPLRLPRLAMFEGLATWVAAGLAAASSLAPRATTAPPLTAPAVVAAAAAGPRSERAGSPVTFTAPRLERTGWAAVHDGESIEMFAARTLGTAERWPEVWAINQGRVLDDLGNRWLEPWRLSAGWELELPPTPQPAVRAPVETPPTSTGNRAPASRPSQEAETITVTAGDSVWRLSEQRLADVGIHDDAATARLVADVAAGNGLRHPDLIYPGQRLRFPSIGAPPDDDTSVSPSQAGAPPPAPDEAPAVHRIRSGDTLWQILKSHYGYVNADLVGDVAAANGLADPSKIPLGTEIVLPPQFQPAAAAPQATTATVTTGPAGQAPAPGAETSPATSTTPTDAPATPATPSPDSPPPPTALPRRSTSAPTRSSSPERSDSTSERLAVVGVTGATVLATGLLLVYRRRRHLAGRRGANHLATPLPAHQAQMLEALVHAADVPLVRWANYQLAALMSGLHPDDVTGVPVVVELSATYGLELLWDTPQHEAPAPWTTSDGSWTWHLAYDADQVLPRQPEPAPLAGLLTVGTRDGGQVLVNLEAFGIVAVTGDPRRAEDLVRSIVLEAGASEELAATTATIVGIRIEGDEQLWRIEAGNTDLARRRLAEAQADYRKVLDDAGLATAFEARLGGDQWDREVHLAAIGPEAVGMLENVTVQPNLGVAVVVAGDTPYARATITIDSDGRATLTPVGLTFDAAGLPVTTASEVAVLLDEADTSSLLGDVNDHNVAQLPDHFADPHPVDDESVNHDPDPTGTDGEGEAQALLNADHDGDIDAWEFPDPIHLIRVLGTPRVEGHSGVGPIELRIVTFVACNGGRATPDQVIDAVWAGRPIERGTFTNRLSKARSQLPGLLLPRTAGSRDLVLADGVTTDLDVMGQLVERARHLSSTSAIELLTQAVELVDGVPFDADGYDWALSRQYHAQACQLIEHAALQLVELALDIAEIETAREACRRGLVGLPLNEPLYCAWMRVEAAAGNRSAVVNAYKTLRYELENLAGPGTYEPSPETTRLYEQLSTSNSYRSA